jgi:uncharacterized membrane protein affecting hemolysin expression
LLTIFKVNYSHEPRSLPKDKDKSATAPPEADSQKKFGFIHSISRRFTVAVGCLVILTMCIFWLISSYYTQSILRQQADTLGQTIARQTASLVTELVLANDLISMNVVLGQLTTGSVIAEAAVLNIDGEIISISSTEVSRPWSLFQVPVDFGEYVAPISLQGASAGTVRVRLDTSYIEAGMANNLSFIGVATLLILAVSVSLIITYFQYLIAFPMRMLNYAIQGIRVGEIETCPNPEINNEVSRLVTQYNATAEFLAKNTFLGNQLPEPGAFESAIQSKDEQFSTAILCIRMDNFQYLASTLEKGVVVSLLNRFYFLAENISGLYNGSVNYCADGEIVIGFNTDHMEDEQCFYAVCAGQLFLKLLNVIVDVPGLAQPINAKFRLAVHVGESTTGLYSPTSKQFNNVSGQCLDQAREICKECPDNSLLVGKEAFEQAGGGSRISGEEFDTVETDEPLVTYLCSNPMSSYKTLIENQAERLNSLMNPKAGSAKTTR